MTLRRTRSAGSLNVAACVHVAGSVVVKRVAVMVGRRVVLR